MQMEQPLAYEGLAIHLKSHGVTRIGTGEAQKG